MRVSLIPPPVLATPLTSEHLEDEVVALRAEKSALERQVKVLLEVLGNVGRERRAEDMLNAPTPPQ